MDDVDQNPGAFAQPGARAPAGGVLGEALRAGLRRAPCLLLGGGALLAFLFVYLHGPDFNWDLLTYHYFTGYAVTHGRLHVDVAPAHMGSFVSPYCNVLVYLANAYLPFPWNGWVLTAIQLLSLPALFGIAVLLDSGTNWRRLSLAGLLAVALSLLSPLWASELGTSFSSSLTAPLILAALWLVLRVVAGRERPSAAAAVLVAGLAAGLGAGLRLTNLLFVVSLPFCLVPLGRARGWRAAGRLAVCLGVGAAAGLALTSWWNLYLWRQWQSPVFPYYNALFGSPYYDAVNFRDLRFAFASVGELLAYMATAWRRTHKTSEVEAAFADARITLLLVLVAVGLAVAGLALARRRTSHGQRRMDPAAAVASALLWFAGVAFGLWAVMFAYSRYLVAVELVAGLLVWVLLRRLLPPRAVAPALAVSLLLCLALVRVPNWRHVRHDRTVRGTGADRFGLQVPAELAATPARYLVAGYYNSYVLAFFHPGSQFLRVDFSPAVDGLVRAALAADSSLPVRVFGFEADSTALAEIPGRYGLPPPRDGGPRWRFQSAVDRLVCYEVTIAAPGRSPASGVAPSGAGSGRGAR